jgi:predicted kinase
MLKDNDDYFSKESEVYDKFIEQIDAAIATQKDVWVDQTSLNRAARNKLFSRLTKKPNEIIGIYFTTPLNIILQRNSQRTGRALVPEDAVVNMFNSLTRPTLDEGFTEILEVE